MAAPVVDPPAAHVAAAEAPRMLDSAFEPAGVAAAGARLVSAAAAVVPPLL